MAEKDKKKSKVSKAKEKGDEEERGEKKIVDETKENDESLEETGEKEEIKESDALPEKEEKGEEPSEETSDDTVKNSTVYGDDFSAVDIEKRFSPKRLLLFVFMIFLFAVIFFSGLLYFYSRDSLPQFSLPRVDLLSRFISEPSPTPTETPSPSPTPEPELTLSDYDVQVLNGSGVSGVAGDAASLLEDEGFEDIEVGNADEQDFEDTEVQMKEDVPDEVFETIVSALDTYTVIEGDLLDGDASFDIVITLGQTIEEEE